MSDESTQSGPDDDPKDGSTAEGRGGSEPEPGMVERVDAFPWGTGFGSGVAAFFVGFATFALLAAVGGSVRVSQGLVQAVKALGNLFYNSFNVPTLFEASGVFGNANVTQQVYRNNITGWARVQRTIEVNGSVVQDAGGTRTFETSTAVPPEVYLLVPVVVLLAFAVGFASGALEPPASASIPRISGLAVAGGLSMAFGFLATALVGSYLLTLPGAPGTPVDVIHPSRLETVLYGFGYPFVAGIAGVVFVHIARLKPWAEGSQGVANVDDTDEDQETPDSSD